MTLAIIYSRASVGMKSPLVTVETHLSPGMAGFYIVGLPEATVKESRDRVRSALLNTHFEFPSKRIIVNLAPADLPKEGGRFDLPIALGILAASGQIPRHLFTHYEFVGELALSGELRPIRGVLPLVLDSQKSGRQLIIPEQNAAEAALVQEANILSAKHLLEVYSHLKGDKLLLQVEAPSVSFKSGTLDLADVKGQFYAKRALEIAAAGKHSMLLIGPPGTGKTMLASRLPSILPALNEQEALEVAAIASISHHGFHSQYWKQIPFRTPHHSCSSGALVGGGRPPRPGEISLSHGGVLFLDELPEFSRHVLECLREPMESGVVTISRASFQTTFPARFQFIAAMNPCPCGYAGSSVDICHCNVEQIKRYRSKISGPLFDRIDMHINVPRLSSYQLLESQIPPSENSAIVQARVIKAHTYQRLRQSSANATLNVKELNQVAVLEQGAQQLLNKVMEKFNFSARSYHRIIKIARTIADLAENPTITQEHLSEAINYRYLDKLSG